MSRTSTLSLQGLRKTYHVEGQALPVLDDINLDIAPGEFVSIVGSSGCGKSTLLRLLIGLENSFDGHILLDGQPVVGTGLERGIVFQDHRLFPWLTVAQNVGLALENSPRSPREKAAAIAEHIALVGLEGFENAYPHQLSGGMSQRVAIARGLVNRPRILLLDEPFGALDAFTREELWCVIRDLHAAQDVTIVLVTHDRFLLDRLCTNLLGFDGKGTVAYFADCDQWLTSLDESSPKSEKEKKLAASAKTEQKAKAGKLSYLEQREYDQMEERILAAEAELELAKIALAELTGATAAVDPSDDSFAG